MLTKIDLNSTNFILCESINGNSNEIDTLYEVLTFNH